MILEKLQTTNLRLIKYNKTTDTPHRQNKNTPTTTPLLYKPNVHKCLFKKVVRTNTKYKPKVRFDTNTNKAPSGTTAC